MIALGYAAKALGGEVVRGSILCPGPGHSRADRSLSVTFRHGAPGGFVVNSFAGDDPLSCKDHVRAVLGLGSGMPESRQSPFHKIMEPLRNLAHGGDRSKPSRQLGDKGKLEAAQRLWREAVPAEGTPVAAYLAGRGLSLPEGTSGAALRYHPNCPFKGQWVPVMLALVRDIRTNKPLGIHRTAITTAGQSATVIGEKRAALGPVAGGAVKLTDDPDVTTCLGIGEGIESTLSLRELPEFGQSPVWAMLNAGNLGNLPVLPGIECLWVAEDHDDAGKRATEDVGRRWTDAGREVFAVRANAFRHDLNDLLTKEAHDA